MHHGAEITGDYWGLPGALTAFAYWDALSAFRYSPLLTLNSAFCILSRAPPPLTTLNLLHRHRLNGFVNGHKKRRLKVVLILWELTDWLLRRLKSAPLNAFPFRSPRGPLQNFTAQ